MCEYVNDHWQDEDRFHLAAYVMWRLNWIHPFVDGNGRTTRAVSYYVLCSKLGFRIPGVKTVPEMIAENKTPYYAALEAADHGHKDGEINVSEMEELLRNLLARQMVLVLEGNTDDKAPAELIKHFTSSDLLDMNRRESRATQVLRSGKSVTLGAIFGGSTLVFFMLLVLLAVFGRPVPKDARYLVIIVLSLFGALSTYFLGGNAIARGRIRVPYLKDPFTIAATGGIATLIILILIGSALFG
jgi:hypothetical protein